MTDRPTRDAAEEPAGDLPVPRAQAPWWYPPRERWLGQLLFVMLGLCASAGGCVGIAGFAADSLPRGEVRSGLQILGCSVPWLLGLVIAALRIRRGKRWRVFEYLAGVCLLYVLGCALWALM